MSNISEQISALEKELSTCINGYISRKIINGKERFYLQWVENGKIKSRYIKSDELNEIRASVERRKQIQENLKELKSTPEGIENNNLRRKAVRNMQNITGYLMSGDYTVATIKNGNITEANEILLPLYLKRTKDVEGWLASRAIDSHRTNSRLLKKALRLKTTDDVQTALAVNAATVTDRYCSNPKAQLQFTKISALKKITLTNLLCEETPTVSHASLQGLLSSLIEVALKSVGSLLTASGGCIKAVTKKNSSPSFLFVSLAKNLDSIWLITKWMGSTSVLWTLQIVQK